MVKPSSSTASTAGVTSRLRNSFLERTFDILEEEKSHDVVSWNADGTSIVIHDNSRFAAEVLPNYFKHNNYPSFVRQLNLYGFKKVISSRQYSVHEFKHPQFRRDSRQLLPKIKRNTNPQAADKRRNAETLLKAIAKLKEKHEVYEKRVAELENSNTHLSDENKLLWSHMNQSRKRQKALSSNMSKVMMFLYQAFGSRAGGLPAIQAGTAEAVAALGEMPLETLIASQAQVVEDSGVAAAAGGSSAALTLGRLLSDVSSVDLPSGVQDGVDDVEDDLDLFTSHPVLNRHNSLELVGGMGDNNGEGNGEDEAADPHWFGDDDDGDDDNTAATTATTAAAHNHALHRLVRSVSSDTTGKYPEDVRNQYTDLATDLHQHFSEQDNTLKRIHTMGSTISENETPHWVHDDEFNPPPNGDGAAALSSPKRRRVNAESTDNDNSNGEAKKAAMAAAAASSAGNDLVRS